MTYLTPGHPDSPHSTKIYNISQWRQVLVMETWVLTIDPSTPECHELITKQQTSNQLLVVAELMQIVLALSTVLGSNHLFFTFSVAGDIYCDSLQTRLVLDYTTTMLCCLSATLLSFSFVSVLVLFMLHPHLTWLGNTWLSKYQSVSLKRNSWSWGWAYQFHQSSNWSTLSLSSGSSKKSKTVS